MFYLSIICACFALVLSAASLFCKTKMLILALQIPANVFYCLSFLFMGAYAGFVGVLIATARTAVFFAFSYNNKQPGLFYLFFFIILSLFSAIFVFKNWFDLLPILGVCIFTYGMWQKNENVLRLTDIATGTLLLIFNLIIANYIGAFQEVIVMFAAAAAIFIYSKKRYIKIIQ